MQAPHLTLYALRSLSGMALITTKATALFFYCLRLNKVPNEFISHEFLLIVLNIGLTLSIKSLLVSYAHDYEQFII